MTHGCDVRMYGWSQGRHSLSSLFINPIHKVRTTMGPSRCVLLGLFSTAIAISFVGLGPACVSARVSPPYGDVADKYTREIELIYHVRTPPLPN